MDWTQELQVIPLTPRETKDRLPLSVMAALPKSKERKSNYNHTDKYLGIQ